MNSAKYNILRGLDLFKSIDDSQINTLAFHAELQQFKKGEYIYNEGDDISYVYLVIRGSVKSGIGSNTEKMILKEIVHQNEIFGENIFTGVKSRREFAQTMSESEMIKIPVSFFKNILEKNPQLCQELTTILITKLSHLEERMSNFMFKKAHSRIIEFLKKLANTQGIKIGLSEILVNHGLSHKEIANITDTSRQTVARVLGDLKRRDIIHFSARKPHKILIRNILNLS